MCVITFHRHDVVVLMTICNAQMAQSFKEGETIEYSGKAVVALMQGKSC